MTLIITILALPNSQTHKYLTPTYSILNSLNVENKLPDRKADVQQF